MLVQLQYNLKIKLCEYWVWKLNQKIEVFFAVYQISKLLGWNPESVAKIDFCNDMLRTNLIIIFHKLWWYCNRQLRSS